MRIGMLGTLEVSSATGEHIEVNGTRLRTLLIRLAQDAGRVVPPHELIDALWAENPPSETSNALQALVSRLRRTLPDGAIESHPGGYRLAVDPDDVDIHRFDRLASAGKAALDHDPRRAVDLLGQAIELWRGPALSDVIEAPFAAAATTHLAERRATAIEDQAAATLAIGNGPASLDALERVIASSLPGSARSAC